MTDETTASATTNPHQVNTERAARIDLPTSVLDITLDAQDAQRAYAACWDGVYQVGLADGRSQKLYEHQSYASGVVVDPARNVLVSAGYDGQLIWYDVKRETVFRRVKAHRFWSWKLARSPNSHCVASVSGQYLAGGERYEPAAEREPSVKLYELASGDLMHALSHVPPVQAVAVSPDSRFIAAANLMGEIRIWDVQTGTPMANWTTDAFTSWGIIKSHCYIGGIHALHFDPVSHDLLAAGMGPMRDPMAGNGRQLWQRFGWQDGQVRQIDETHPDESGEGLMETLAFHPHQPLFLMGGRLRGGEWNAALFSSTSGRRVHKLNTGYRMTSALFDTAGSRLVVAGADKQQPPKDGVYPPFGIIEVYQLTTEVA